MTTTATKTEITLEIIACDLCGATDAQPYLDVRDHFYQVGQPQQFQLVKCPHCGLIFLNPRPDKTSIGAFYPNLDYHAFKPTAGWKARISALLRNRIAKSLLRGLPPRANVLEIGAGTGELLASFRALGANVMGVEPNQAAVDFAHKNYHLIMSTGMLLDVHLEDGKYDLVLMKYALEHVQSPRADLRIIHDLLKPGGKAVFWVPNNASLDARIFGRYWRGLDAPRHFYIFTPETMRQELEAAHLHLERVIYSPVPNDFTGSAESWLRDHGAAGQLADFLGMKNPLALLTWLPISALAAAFHASGRIQVIASRRD